MCVSITRNLAPHWRVSARNAPFGYEIWDLCVALAARGDGDALQPSALTLSENTPNSHLTWSTAKQVYQRKQKLAHFSKAYRDDLENRMWSCALFGTNLKWEEPGQKIRLVHNILNCEPGSKKWESELIFSRHQGAEGFKINCEERGKLVSDELRVFFTTGWVTHASNSLTPRLFILSPSWKREKSALMSLSVEREINLIKTSNRQLLMFGARQRLAGNTQHWCVVWCVRALWLSTIHFSCVCLCKMINK